MNSRRSALLGVQRPRYQHLPPGKVTSAGREAVELAASAGLVCDDWQEFVLEEALAERRDGKWCAFEVGLIVPRQNGKGSILEVLELASLFLFGAELVIHSAHEFKTAREHFLRMQRLVHASDELFEQVQYIHTGAGAESIGLRNGARLNFVARSRGSLRGFSGDLVVLDEAYSLPVEAVGAMGPALSAMPNPQVWYTSSAPHSDSVVLHNLRKRGMDGDGSRLAFFEWGNDADVDQGDNTFVAYANPAAGSRLSWDNINAERDMLAPLGDEFGRERLGIPAELDLGSGVFGDAWAACIDQDSQPVGNVAFALDVAPDMKFASFAAAGFRDDGIAHIELVERHAGTGWVLGRAQYYAEHYGPIVLDARAPVGGLIQELRDAGVKFVELPDGELPRGCSALQKRVLDGTVRHIGQAPLDNAVSGAAIKPAVDAWRWSRANSRVDISPLVACTIALRWASEPRPAPSKYWSAEELWSNA